ncbi:YIP1 family protein [Sphingobacterium sp. UBA5670]|uniref:YIP1 family protein n=1 Tax=Sphingobacterium sp. UBA5670 TaxID=1947502 RepID=UPI0025CC2CA4|nr:YIP1 family protein [Sphingobacterium sp. UBA5670]
MKVKQIFQNPFAEFTEWELFFAGVFGFLLSSYIIYLSGQQFNGFMHFYQPEMTVSLWAVLRVHAYMVLAPFVLLYGIGMLLNRKTRIIDVMNVVLIIPFPLYLVLFLGKLLNQDTFTDQVLKAVQSGDHTLAGVDKTEMFLFGMLGIISLLLLFYQFYLLVKGMNVAVNNKKTGINILFVALYFILDLCIQFNF